VEFVRYKKYTTKTLLNIEEGVYASFVNIKVKASVNKRYKLLKEDKMSNAVFTHFLVRSFMTINNLSKDSAFNYLDDLVKFEVYKETNKIGDKYENKNTDIIPR
tara:strand:+ start:16846 stop:17157 length:312 start_codon:yes stop_codon:yes gene_type:complete